MDDYPVLEAAEARYTELKAAAEAETPTGPAEPDEPDQPSGESNNCPWDDVDHGPSLWGRIVRIVHSILYFFARLFGLR